MTKIVDLPKVAIYDSHKTRPFVMRMWAVTDEGERFSFLRWTTKQEWKDVYEGLPEEDQGNAMKKYFWPFAEEAYARLLEQRMSEEEWEEVYGEDAQE